MPRRAKRPCGKPGCPELIETGSYCPEHDRQVSRERHGQRRKDPAQARYYGSARWKRIRAMVRQEEPACRLCREEGRVSATAVVDHIDGNWRNEARENLQGLCRPCDRTKTARQHRGRAATVLSGGASRHRNPHPSSGLYESGSSTNGR